MRIAVSLGLAMLAAACMAPAASAQAPGVPEAEFREVTSRARSISNDYEEDRYLTGVLERTDLSSEQRISVLWQRAVNRSNGMQDKKAAVQDFEAALALKPAKPETAASLTELADYARGQLAASEARLADPAAAADMTGRFGDLIAAGRLPEAAAYLRTTYAADKKARDSRLGFRAMHYQRLIDSGYLCRAQVESTGGVTWKASGKNQYANWCEPAGQGQ